MYALGRWTRLLALAALLVFAPVARAAEAPLTVDRYVDLVLRAHPSVRASRAREASASAESRAARLFPDPALELSLGRGRPTEGGAEQGGESGLSVTQTIPWLPARSASVAAADRSADALRAEASATRRDLAADAAVAFRRLQEARALADIAREAEADARSLVELVTRRTEVGEGREVDRIKARVEWLRQQRELGAAKREAAAAEAIVRTLAVEPLPRPLEIEGALPTSSVARPGGPEAPEPALARSPSLLKARAEAARGEALLSFARRARAPDLGLSLFRQREFDRDAWGISLGVTLPLWNAKRGEIARADAAAALARAEAEGTFVALSAALEGRRRDADVAAAQAAVLTDELVPAASESLRLARLLFEEGETSLLDLLDAQRTARDARREEIRARFELAVALSELERLIGPGTSTTTTSGEER